MRMRSSWSKSWGASSINLKCPSLCCSSSWWSSKAAILMLKRNKRTKKRQMKTKKWMKAIQITKLCNNRSCISSSKANLGHFKTCQANTRETSRCNPISPLTSSRVARCRLIRICWISWMNIWTARIKNNYSKIYHRTIYYSCSTWLNSCKRAKTLVKISKARCSRTWQGRVKTALVE